MITDGCSPVVPSGALGGCQKAVSHRARNPAWYYNIAAHPDEVQIEVDGRTIPVTAKQLHGPERDEAWQQITTAAPRFAQYELKTDRVMPVIRLVPR